MAPSRLLAMLAAPAFVAQAQNIIPVVNETALPCDIEECYNGGTCTNLENGGFQCACTWGFTGENCETGEFWTLQQWQSNTCGETAPWRCFRLQMGACIDTGFVDGNFPNNKAWWGRLTHVNENGGLYTIDLCWGEGEEGVDEPGYDPEDRCNCEYHWTNIRRLGKNSLGPPTGGDVQRDSDECHKLERITSSRLVNSTGVMTGDKENTLCGEPVCTNETLCGAAHRGMPRVLAAVLALAAAVLQ